MEVPEILLVACKKDDMYEYSTSYVDGQGLTVVLPIQELMTF